MGDSGKLQICVDPRLIPLFQRSYPKAEVGTYDDRTLTDDAGNKALRLVPFAGGANKPDFWAPMGSALISIWHARMPGARVTSMAIVFLTRSYATMTASVGHSGLALSFSITLAMCASPLMTSV